MQVTHQNEFVTHAVIGGKKAIDFGISSSTEFFNILSSTLYKDQILAVVREVLCNAWDAHIEAGCTSVPVKVTINDDVFTVKDFGNGIHHDDMGQIYGTYGNSTKKNDGNQTGGFGLGCKAPFAYTDHFEVISCHAGVKTIYNLSKSSAQAQGKPGIIPIASFATTETGLQVSIRLKNSTDTHKFIELVNRISSNGDMRVTYNDDLVKPLGFDASKSNYLITSKHILGCYMPIMVRYGNVVYPVDVDEKLAGITAIKQHLKKISSGNPKQIIFQAPAHSISVTPSRESLSMQDHTVNTLNKLINGFLGVVSNEFMKECTDIADETITKAVTDIRIDALLCRENKLPFIIKPKDSDHISDPREMANTYLSHSYPDSLDFRKKDIKTRLNLMVNNNLLDRGLVQTYLRDTASVTKVFNDRYVNYEKNDWLQRRVLAPLLSKVATAGIDHNRLYVCDPKDSNSPSQYYSANQKMPLVKVIKASPVHLFATLPYLRNIVVLSSSKTGMVERAFKHKVFTKLGATHGFIFYHTGLKAADKEKALVFFRATGMVVVDLTAKEEDEYPVAKVAPKPRIPKKKGVIALSTIADGKYVNNRKYFYEDPVMNEEPEFIIQLSFRSNSNETFEGLDHAAATLVTKLFGDKGGLVNTQASKDRWISKGAKEFKPYITEVVCDYIQSSAAIKDYLAKDIDLYNIRYANRALPIIRDTPELCVAFNMGNPLSGIDADYLALWKFINTNSYFNLGTKIAETRKYIKGITKDVDITALETKLDNNKIMGAIDMSNIRYALQDKTLPADSRKSLINIFIAAING